MSNPYAPPSAPLGKELKPGELPPLFEHLSEQSTWRLVGLSAITLLVYTAFYTRRQTLRMNQHLQEAEQLAMWLPNIIIFLSVASVALVPVYFVVPEGDPVESLSDFVDAALNLTLLFWGFSARNRMNFMTGAPRGALPWFNALWTFLFSPWYFNYKVNCVRAAESGPGAA